MVGLEGGDQASVVRFLRPGQVGRYIIIGRIRFIGAVDKILRIVLKRIVSADRLVRGILPVDFIGRIRPCGIDRSEFPVGFSLLLRCGRIGGRCSCACGSVGGLVLLADIHKRIGRNKRLLPVNGRLPRRAVILRGIISFCGFGRLPYHGSTGGRLRCGSGFRFRLRLRFWLRCGFRRFHRLRLFLCQLVVIQLP